MSKVLPPNPLPGKPPLQQQAEAVWADWIFGFLMGLVVTATFFLARDGGNRPSTPEVYLDPIVVAPQGCIHVDSFVATSETEIVLWRCWRTVKEDSTTTEEGR